MDLMYNCTLVFDIDAIVLHTNPVTVGGGEKKITFDTLSCRPLSALFNVEVHYLYVSLLLVCMICVSPVKLGFVSGLAVAYVYLLQ